MKTYMAFRKRLACIRLKRRVNKAQKQSFKSARKSGSNPTNLLLDRKARKDLKKFSLLVSEKLIRKC